MISLHLLVKILEKETEDEASAIGYYIAKRMAEVVEDEGIELDEIPASLKVYIKHLGWEAEIERRFEENEELSATDEGYDSIQRRSTTTANEMALIPSPLLEDKSQGGLQTASGETRRVGQKRGKVGDRRDFSAQKEFSVPKALSVVKVLSV